MSDVEYLYLNCACSDSSHLARVVFDPDQEFSIRDGGEIYLHMQMHPYLSWWRRVWVAVQYVFGHDSRCHWGETILTEKDRVKLVEFLQR